MTIASYVGDTVVIDVTVTEDGGAKDITGATVRASIRNPDTRVKTTLLPTITDAPNGVVQIVVPKTAMIRIGNWKIELEVALSGESQTVYQEDIDAQDALLTD